MTHILNPEDLWKKICDEARELQQQTPSLSLWFEESILQFDNFAQALAYQLANRLHDENLDQKSLEQTFVEKQKQVNDITAHAIADLCACYERDPACDKYLMPLLYFKGYQSLQAQRFAHQAWKAGEHAFAYYLQNQMSCEFSVDMHPAVKLGHGIMLDHATGVVMGETTVVGNNVSILHGVTLGGCGITEGVRHPTIGDGVLISTGAKILGNVHIGEGAKIAAGSLVLENVAAHTTVAGVPAKIVGKPKTDAPAEEMDQQIV